ncbi:NAD(P)-dependent alcohol dehydrogenase [Xanthomonas citri pv. malvacearum]|uniref:NAD(P)-dependent alcohol dehydrogenase n=1 Tax=Xanthomonas campestris pv. malvacearum TaxID=86040 RepID=A0AA44Z4Q7_XANCM|nr:NAD(P)-dependent alcohol dehydrogenase [Xanthomonas citri]OOW59065.1 alcohol dehydrogenase [Xanthomonas campestris pv. thespesiae]OOW82399.1 alcohol dehydrogenase [Xanthomonas campestris pv. leeana]AOL19064.1 alcohol dehydrogenase [Xanthomonas citri pv. malvacearum]ASN00637.1 alcohol dehydrogenase [Xanthomonas citri pv. malvacearum]ASN10231.1 alcohol dehydrogenase [Xanthomonas citri pv. malvacearum]
MQAIRLRHPAAIASLQSVALPDPGQPARGQIRVRLHASSLNFHDLGVVLGQMPTADGRIPMSDGAGVVEAVGPEVDEFAVGDHVVSTFFPQWLDGEPLHAGFATTPGDGVDGYARSAVVADARAFTHAPRGYSHAEAATLTTAGVTAWRALAVNGGLKAGDSVLVLGTGGVSIFALQLAKATGARVIATSSSDEKLEKVRALGADHVINYRQHPEWSAQVLDITEGRGVDHVVEVGGPGTLTQSIRAARVGGHIALIGVLTGAGGPVPTAEMMGRQQRLQGLVVGSRKHQQDLVRALDSLPLRPVIDRSFALDEIGEAFALQKSGGHLGKIALEF